MTTDHQTATGSCSTAALGPSNRATMRIHNLYADENGDTHFRDVEIELDDTGPDGTVSRIFPASGVIFRITPADWFFDWHATTRRQYVVNLDAPHQVTASDGESRIIGTGEI